MRTQLQMRIECMAKNQTTYPQNTYFKDGNDIAFNNPHQFLNDMNPYSSFSNFLSEEDFREAESYEEIKPAVQGQLAMMEFGNSLVDILKNTNPTFLGKLKGISKHYMLLNRTGKAVKKASKSTIKNNGGLSKLIVTKSIMPSLLYSQSLEDKHQHLERCIYSFNM